MSDGLPDGHDWPSLPYAEWRGTRDALHMYTQVLGKLRLALSPFEPEWANVPLYVTARGLTTSPIPIGMRAIDAELDLIGNELVLRSSEGHVARRPLGGPVATFYTDVMTLLRRMGIDVKISVVPSEVAHPVPFPDDHAERAYDAHLATVFHRVLSMVDLVFREHRGSFRGRTTPVHFFWGTFDLALTRYSGSPASPAPAAGFIARRGEDAEQICAGWWPGDERVPYPAFYSYAYPPPDGLGRISLTPALGGWNADSGEFILPYDTARSASDPKQAILAFLDASYEAAARLLGWSSALTVSATSALTR